MHMDRSVGVKQADRVNSFDVQNSKTKTHQKRNLQPTFTSSS